jgi:hypothetical protein
VTKPDGASYIEASRSAAQEFDSRVFWLAGGSIGLSLTFYQGLVTVSAVERPWLLFLGWLALIGAILVVMTSFQLSIRSCNDFAQYESAGGEDGGLRDHGVRLSERVVHLNWASLALLALGLLLVCAFFFGNAGFSDSKETGSAGSQEATSTTAP